MGILPEFASAQVVYLGVWARVVCLGSLGFALGASVLFGFALIANTAVVCLGLLGCLGGVSVSHGFALAKR